jgi:hypothetical protein
VIDNASFDVFVYGIGSVRMADDVQVGLPFKTERQRPADQTDAEYGDSCQILSTFLTL